MGFASICSWFFTFVRNPCLFAALTGTAIHLSSLLSRSLWARPPVSAVLPLPAEDFSPSAHSILAASLTIVFMRVSCFPDGVACKSRVMPSPIQMEVQQFVEFCIGSTHDFHSGFLDSLRPATATTTADSESALPVPTLFSALLFQSSHHSISRPLVRKNPMEGPRWLVLQKTRKAWEKYFY